MSLARSGDQICDCCGNIVDKKKAGAEKTTEFLCSNCWKILQKVHPETD